MGKQIQHEDTKPQILQDIYRGYVDVKKLFDIVDICKPGIDELICQFGSPQQESNQHSYSAKQRKNLMTFYKK